MTAKQTILAKGGPNRSAIIAIEKFLAQMNRAPRVRDCGYCHHCYAYTHVQPCLCTQPQKQQAWERHLAYDALHWAHIDQQIPHLRALAQALSQTTATWTTATRTRHRPGFHTTLGNHFEATITIETNQFNMFADDAHNRCLSWYKPTGKFLWEIMWPGRDWDQLAHGTANIPAQAVQDMTTAWQAFYATLPRTI